MNLGRKREIYVEKLFQFEDTQQKNGRSILHISLALFYILNGVFPSNGKWCIGRYENTFCFHIKCEEETCRV